MKKSKNKKIDFKYNLKEYFKVVAKYKFLFIILSLSVILTEILFVADKFLYKRIIDDGENFVSGILPQPVFLKTLTIIAIIFIVIVILRSLGNWARAHLLAVIEPKLIKDVKEKYFNHILSLDHKFHTTHKTGSLISRLSRGSRAIENLSDVIFFQASPLVIQLILITISFLVFTKAAAIVLILTTVSFVLYSVRIQNVQRKSRLEWNKTADRENGFVSDVFTNIDSVKFYGQEKKISRKFDNFTERTRKSSSKFWDYFSALSLGQTLILGIGILALFYVSVKEFLAGKITLGTIVFVYTLFGNVINNLFSFVWGIRNFYNSMADMQDLFEYGKVQNEIKDKPHAKELKIREGEIEFRNVSFKYEKKRLFNNFNLRIKPREKVALVGHSGSGKTTIVKLLNRFYNVDKGEILIDGEDIKDFKQESLRSETGIVPQECILFDDTVYNNIKFAKPNAEKSEVLNAIKLAQLENVIKNFPNGMNTIVGERGVKLSGGEKQRVSIARAILANKKVLILDEATSALDSRTENEIQKALQNLLRGKTSIMIAHRLSTIMNADRIIVMKDGKIVQQGKHSELIKQPGEYRSLWNLQKGGYLED